MEKSDIKAHALIYIGNMHIIKKPKHLVKLELLEEVEPHLLNSMPNSLDGQNGYLLLYLRCLLAKRRILIALQLRPLQLIANPMWALNETLDISKKKTNSLKGFIGK